MKSLMPFVLLMPMILSAGPARAESRPAVVDDRCRDRYCPQPFPRPGSCPEGTHRVFDEYQGRYICVPNDDYSPRPRPWYDESYKKMSDSIGGDDQAAKGAALNAFFDAALPGKDGGMKDAVAAPASGGGAHALTPRAGWRLAHTDPSVPLPPTGGKPRPGSRGEARFMTVGAVDDLGNKLRDRNDEKLKEATKQQKDTEKRWKDYKEGKSVSPHPPVVDEVSIGGKG